MAESNKDNKQLILDVKDLKKSFADKVVLNGIDVQIYKGDIVCVIGPSGRSHRRPDHL